MEDSDVSKINARCIEVCCATYLVAIEVCRATSPCLSKQCRASGWWTGLREVLI